MSTLSPLIVTGASGWFGRTALYEYEQQFGPKALRSNIIACASSNRLIDIRSPYGPIRAVGINELDYISGAAGLIHFAFLTRERVTSVGLNQYIAQNRAITARMAAFICRNPGIPIITTSSGAAAIFDGAELDLTSNPYAALKQEEENLWRRSGSERMAIVFRVYAASGRFIKDPKLFALGDFLSSALAGKRIEVRSSRHVIRSYAHVGTMVRLFWAMLMAPTGPGFRQIDAAMHTISLVDLAKLISQQWGLPEPNVHIDPSLPADDYWADSRPFRDLLRQYSIKAPDLIEQIQETASAMAWSK
jgi:nucleoside-diphosphate-sugar epimerase